MGDEYRRFWIASSDAGLRERLLAEAFEAGAEGAEEVDASEASPGTGTLATHGSPTTRDPGAAFAGLRACVYARDAVIGDVRRALEAVLADEQARGGEAWTTAVIGPVEDLPAVDWTEEWKRGLGPIVISERLVVRPPFAAYALGDGQREIVIDPGQAFGTGTHASTRLCLEWIDLLLLDDAGRARHRRVLDVGTGSGVLALAAVALGAREAIGFDLDPVAIEAAVAAAADNRLERGARFLCAPIESIAPQPGFDLVVANLLKRELLPIAGEIAERLAPGGSLVLAGLLEEDGDEVARCFSPHGLVERERRVRADGVGHWIAPRYVRSEGADASAPSRARQSA